MATLTPLAKGLIGLAVIGGMASAVWNLGLKDYMAAATVAAQQPDTLEQALRRLDFGAAGASGGRRFGLGGSAAAKHETLCMYRGCQPDKGTDQRQR